MMDKQERKEKLAAYKERKRVGGVYVIQNRFTGKMLLQSAVDLRGGENRFRFLKQTGSCPSPVLQQDWRQYGGDAFTLKVLETLDQKEDQTEKEFAQDIKTLEELWLERLKPSELY